MSWKDRLSKASFRGVPFYVEGSSLTAGRRVSVRRLAGFDGSKQQDLGAEPDEFDVEAFLASDEFDTERQKLVKALTTAGTGPLVLPTYGEKNVRITRGPMVSERRAERGYCTVRFSCVVEPDSKGLRARPSTKGKLDAAGKRLGDSAKADFGQTYKPEGMPSSKMNGPLNAINKATEALQGVQNKIQSVTNVVEDYSAAINNLSAAANTIMNTPALLSSVLTGLVLSVIGLTEIGQDAITTTPYDQAKGVRALDQSSRALISLGSDVPADGDTPLATQEAQNTRAVNRLVRATALGATAQSLSEQTFDSSTLALSMLETLGAEIDALSDYSATDELYYSLLDVRSALVDHLTQTAVDLPSTQTISQWTEVPALLLAHQLYGDASRESEIVARNRSPDPNALQGDLEVLAP